MNAISFTAGPRCGPLPCEPLTRSYAKGGPTAASGGWLAQKPVRTFKNHPRGVGVRNLMRRLDTRSDERVSSLSRSVICRAPDLPQSRRWNRESARKFHDLFSSRRLSHDHRRRLRGRRVVPQRKPIEVLYDDVSTEAPAVYDYNEVVQEITDGLTGEYL